MQILTQLIFSGIALGMIYAVIAFGYQLTFATSDTLNFGQGDALMLGALVGLTLVGLGVNYWLMIPIVCVFGAFQGIIFKNVAENVWGRDDLKFPSPLPESPMHFLGANVLPMEILVVVGAVLMMLAVEVFNRKSIYGKAVVATFNDRDAAKLMGINTGLVITFSYALSSMSAAFAGVLIAPLTLTGATMGAVLGLKAFAVAIIGGLTSGMGIIVGGIILGVAETTTGFYISTGYKDVPGLGLLLIVLAVRPQGLFGKSVIKKV
jgi:branched-chain amino acid transport system permease protein